MTYSSGDFQGSDFEAVLARQEAHLEVNEEVRSTFYDSVVEMFELDLSVLPGFSGTEREWSRCHGERVQRGRQYYAAISSHGCPEIADSAF